MLLPVNTQMNWSLLEEGGYVPEQVYNYDKIGLCYTFILAEMKPINVRDLNSTRTA